MYDPQANVPLIVGRDYVLVYGHKVPFVAHDPRSRTKAIAEAKKFGAERQAIMRQQAGRPLTMREQISGELALPQERAKPKIYSQPDGPDPNTNHWRNRLHDLRRQTALTQDEKARLQRRIEFAARMADEWDAQHNAELAMEGQRENDDVARIQKHAADAYEAVRNSPTSTVADIVARKRLLKLANSPDLNPGDYWTEIRSIDGESPEPPAAPARDSDMPHPIYEHLLTR